MRFARKAGLDDTALSKAIQDAERSLIAADLGGGVIKQRIARLGQGKSGGFRTLIVFRAGVRAVFVHGFAKNEKGNIGPDELVALKRLIRIDGLRRQGHRPCACVRNLDRGDV